MLRWYRRDYAPVAILIPINNMQNNTSYPLYQYSIFLSGREEQLVIRADSFEELIEAKKNIDKILIKRETSVPQDATTAVETLLCARCGLPATIKSGISKKNGKAWSAIFCSSENKSHTVWQ